MSATRDQSQKITFVYSNLYTLYRKGLDRAREGATEESSAAQPSLAAEALARLAATRGTTSGAVLKADQAQAREARPLAIARPAPAPSKAPAHVTRYTPAELIGKRVARPASIAEARRPEGLKGAIRPAPTESEKRELSALQDLRKNLKSLNELQARLRFMLQELEELVKE